MEKSGGVAWRGSADGLAWGRRLQEGYAVVEVVEGDEYALFLRPFPHPAVAAVTPRQHLDPPSTAAHSLQVGVETHAVGKAAAVAGEQHGNAGVPVVVERIPEHRGLQGLVYALFPALQRAAFQ